MGCGVAPSTSMSQILWGSLSIGAERLGAVFLGREGMKPACHPVLQVVRCSLEGAACAWGVAAGSQPCQPCTKIPNASRAVCEPLGALRDALPAQELSLELGAISASCLYLAAWECPSAVLHSSWGLWVLGSGWRIYTVHSLL